MNGSGHGMLARSMMGQRVGQPAMGHVIGRWLILLGAIGAFAFTPQANGGVIYFEDFSLQDGKGAIGPFPTLDVSGVDWTIDISAATLGAATDWFQVVDGRFDVRDVDGRSSWLSPLIDLSGVAGPVELSLWAGEDGDLETSDFLDVLYSIDGGPFVLIENWQGAGAAGALLQGHTLIGDRAIGGATDDADWGATLVTQSVFAANSLRIRVDVDTNANTERIRFDDVTVRAPTVPEPVTVPEPATLASFLAIAVVAGGLRRTRRRGER
ncbi:PEP-CTERM sorting domain-containing protein [Roseiconus nitratireducens]|nr:PEP-CTERM sorting domain-containing protein [Roseiconus nitratireducens]